MYLASVISLPILTNPMSELKKIGLKIFALVIDIVLFGFKIIKQVSLPGRKRRGNLLSSLFIFFIGIVERLNFFEHGIFNMTALFRKKYVKKAFFTMGFILFLLSLFEWTGDCSFYNNFASTSTGRFSLTTEKKTVVSKEERVILIADKVNAHYQLSDFTSVHFPSFTHIPRQKRFLLNCSLRI